MASTSYCATPSPSLRCSAAFFPTFASPPPALRFAVPPLLPRRLAISPPRVRIPAVASALESLVQESDDEDEEDDGSGLFKDEAWASADERDAVRSPELVVPELEELPEQWRRSRIAWLCKELPAYKHSTFTRILNAQRKWLTQEDATYVAVHCLRIRDNDAAFRVFSWMERQHWYRFNFALATRVADFLGREGKVEKCREMFEAMVKQGRVPAESTFHILTVAYLSTPRGRCLEHACTIYNQMIQMGGYKPRLSLHNSLFRALVSKTGGTAKHNLRQAEFVYHNLVTTNLEVHKEVYAGLIWLHSYQDVIDRDRIIALRKEMKQAGFDESIDVLVSVMRAFSKEGRVQETEATWHEILQRGSELPAQAYVCRMEVYARTGEPMKSLDIFREMKRQSIPPNVATYHKIIEIMANAEEIDVAEQLMDEFSESHMKHLMPAFLALMYMYLDLDMHEKFELTFSKCLARCRPNRILYIIYLESLIRAGNVEKAEEVFDEMHKKGTIGTNAKSCNIMLRGYISAEDYQKAEKVYDMMCKKKYDVQEDLLEELQTGLRLGKKVAVKPKPVSIKLDQEQREILIGLLLGGTQIESHAQRGVHIVHFKFQEDSDAHSVLRVHIHERFFEWLTSASRSFEDESKIPYEFSTIPHLHFGFFADQFFLKGQPVLPKLIHRWLSPRVLAYWFMFGGLKLSSGDIVLKVSGGNSEGVERIVNSLHAQSLPSKVKRKGQFFWIGFQGSNADSFWKVIEPYVLDGFLGLTTQESGTAGSGDDQETDTDSDDDAHKYGSEE
ncbi:pentatricopeptide repeat-containing protein OTP51, chloroplastic-like [Triticum dicoccoides]|uniref:pentatricopeptide repeat-containing protein OTP51, chloroplastic-like n=1 Tax=Triticum dicoccoides TaxID=85692 RepID=UPI000E7B607D|nr:pentatricopeptide repeat-containing protein OTP51, chloroplastic-like [Triticum dicoccoides]